MIKGAIVVVRHPDKWPNPYGLRGASGVVQEVWMGRARVYWPGREREFSSWLPVDDLVAW